MRLWENAYGRPRFFSPDWELNAGPDGIEGTADDGTASLFGNTTLFTGREFDAETGLFYYRARYFSPELGRFLSRDPIGFSAGDANLFRYCGNAPLDQTDPSGEIEIGKYGGYILVYNLSGKHESGLDLHPAGGSLWVHAHIVKDGKVIARVGENGKPLPGEHALPPTAKKLIERHQKELRKIIAKGRRQLALWQQQQALARRVPPGTGNVGRVIGGIGSLIVSAKFLEAAFANGADKEIETAVEAARKFAEKKSCLSCTDYMTAMHDLFDALGMPGEITALVTREHILRICSQLP